MSWLDKKTYKQRKNLSSNIPAQPEYWAPTSHQEKKMACYNPLIRIEYPIDIGYRITKTGKITTVATIMSEAQFRAKMGNRELKNNETKIPCGQCIGCRLEYSRQWANRITLEAKKYKQEECWFITLTYNDENIPTNTITNKKTGEIIQGLTLSKKDLTLFMKNLRRHYEYHYGHKGIRFYAAGEYGETTKRPHYHICIFNMPINTELIRVKENQLGQRIWTNKEIEKIWGKGFIAIAKQSWETAAYTARYMLKKQKGQDAEWFYKSQAIIPEFTQMSRKPGIGKEYYDKHSEKIYENDEIILKKGEKTQKIKPPRYYDKLYDIENHDMMEEIKLNRRINAAAKEKIELSRTSMKEEELREVKKRSQQQKIRKLRRTL